MSCTGVSGGLVDRMRSIDDHPYVLHLQLAQRARARRLEQNLTQEGLAQRSGVPLGTLKRFESTGEISLDSLIRLAVALGADDGLRELFPPRPVETIDALLASRPARQRGRRR